jgi:hypothetical protein
MDWTGLDWTGRLTAWDELQQRSICGVHTDLGYISWERRWEILYMETAISEALGGVLNKHGTCRPFWIFVRPGWPDEHRAVWMAIGA